MAAIAAASRATAPTTEPPGPASAWTILGSIGSSRSKATAR
jgi:hypothetical protein